MNDKIIVFGTGSVAQNFLEIVDLEKVDIIAFVNSNIEGEFWGYPIIKPESIQKYSYDYIVIASGYVHKIKNILLKNDVNKDKIVSYIFDESITFQCASNVMNQWLEREYNRNIVFRYFKENVQIPMFYPAVMWDNNSTITSFCKDYVREQTISLLASLLQARDIKGNVAELGVYQGDFSVVINKFFFDFPFYLYDTFEGFLGTDISSDSTIKNVRGEEQKFHDTSVELVLSRLKYNQEIIVRKGYFPSSLGDETGFSFVSIDFNLYGPVRDALNAFYPRMLKGGYILVSDYFCPFYEGSRKAVDEWCRINRIGIVPMADFYGSVIIVKE